MRSSHQPKKLKKVIVGKFNPYSSDSSNSSEEISDYHSSNESSDESSDSKSRQQLNETKWRSDKTSKFPIVTSESASKVGTAIHEPKHSEKGNRQNSFRKLIGSLQ